MNLWSGAGGRRSVVTQGYRPMWCMWLRQSARMWTRGKAPRCVGATITSLGAIGY